MNVYEQERNLTKTLKDVRALIEHAGPSFTEDLKPYLPGLYTFLCTCVTDFIKEANERSIRLLIQILWTLGTIIPSVQITDIILIDVINRIILLLENNNYTIIRTEVLWVLANVAARSEAGRLQILQKTSFVENLEKIASTLASEESLEREPKRLKQNEPIEGIPPVSQKEPMMAAWLLRTLCQYSSSDDGRTTWETVVPLMQNLYTSCDTIETKYESVTDPVQRTYAEDWGPAEKIAPLTICTSNEARLQELIHCDRPDESTTTHTPSSPVSCASSISSTSLFDEKPMVPIAGAHLIRKKEKNNKTASTCSETRPSSKGSNSPKIEKMNIAIKAENCNTDNNTKVNDVKDNVNENTIISSEDTTTPHSISENSHKKGLEEKIEKYFGETDIEKKNVVEKARINSNNSIPFHNENVIPPTFIEVKIPVTSSKKVTSKGPGVIRVLAKRPRLPKTELDDYYYEMRRWSITKEVYPLGSPELELKMEEDKEKKRLEAIAKAEEEALAIAKAEEEALAKKQAEEGSTKQGSESETPQPENKIEGTTVPDATESHKNPSTNEPTPMDVDKTGSKNNIGDNGENLENVQEIKQTTTPTTTDQKEKLIIKNIEKGTIQIKSIPGEKKKMTAKELAIQNFRKPPFKFQAPFPTESWNESTHRINSCFNVMKPYETFHEDGFSIQKHSKLILASVDPNLPQENDENDYLLLASLYGLQDAASSLLRKSSVDEEVMNKRWLQLQDKEILKRMISTALSIDPALSKNTKLSSVTIQIYLPTLHYLSSLWAYAAKGKKSIPQSDTSTVDGVSNPDQSSDVVMDDINTPDNNPVESQREIILKDAKIDNIIFHGLQHSCSSRLIILKALQAAASVSCLPYMEAFGKCLDDSLVLAPIILLEQWVRTATALIKADESLEKIFLEKGGVQRAIQLLAPLQTHRVLVIHQHYAADQDRSMIKILTLKLLDYLHEKNKAMIEILSPFQLEATLEICQEDVNMKVCNLADNLIVKYYSE